MRHRLVAFLSLISALCAQTGIVVEGTVVNRATRQGISGVSVTLDRGTAGLAYRATSDVSGAFRLANIEPGEYQPLFEKPGYSLAEAVAKMHLEAGATGVRLNAVMLPWTRLSGRVLDPQDRPLPGVRVTLVPTRAARGSTGNTATTGETGTFLIAMPPGSYRLLADPYLVDNLRRGALNTAVPPEGRAWAPTYYPATADPEGAQPIVTSTGDLSGFDIHLQAIATFHVRGTVLDTRGQPARGVAVRLVPPPSAWWEPEEGEVASGDKGAFDIPNARPGDWRVVAEVENGESSLLGHAEARLKDADVAGVSVRLAAPFAVTGTVQGAKTRNPDDACEATTVSLLSTEIARDTSGEAHENGAFQIPDVYPGRYKVEVCGVSAGHYLASVLLGDRDVLGHEFALAPGSPALRVVFKSDGGAVRGTVADGAGATVALVPADDALLDTMFIATTVAGEGGRYEIAGVRPGEYRAFAFDRIGDADALTDAVFLRSLAARATAVTVARAQAVALDLKLVRWPE